MLWRTPIQRMTSDQGQASSYLTDESAEKWGLLSHRLMSQAGGGSAQGVWGAQSWIPICHCWRYEHRWSSCMLQSVWTIFNRTEVSEGCTAYFAAHPSEISIPSAASWANPACIAKDKIEFQSLGYQPSPWNTEARCGSSVYPHVVWIRWLHRHRVTRSQLLNNITQQPQTFSHIALLMHLY